MRQAWPLCALALLAASCGGGTGAGTDAGDAAGDVEDSADGTAGDPDVAPEPETDTPEDETGEPGECDESIGPLEAYEEECYISSDGWDYLATVEGTIAAIPYSYIAIELWHTMGGPSAPGTYSFTDANYDECGLCSVVRMDCEETCRAEFLLTSGTIEVNELGALGGTFAGRIVSASGIEVTIDMGTYHSTPVEGGGTICVEDLSFSTEVTEF
jgi:hypothetical protein